VIPWLLATLVVVLFFSSQTCHFYIKVFLHYLIMLLGTALPIPLALLRPMNVRNTNICSFVTVNLSRIFGITYEVRGLEYLDKDESGVIVCNHQSSLDVTTMMVMWPKMPKCVSVVKKELLYAGTFGIVSWLSGTVFVDRSNSARAQKSLNYALTYLTDKKVKLWFFPEGTRNDTGTMLPFKKGAFHLAIQSQRPIIPMTISSYSSFYSKRIKKFDNGGKVIINIMPPVPTEGKTANDLQSLMDDVRKQMELSFEKTSGEVALLTDTPKKNL